jgi:hypothetical protein
MKKQLCVLILVIAVFLGMPLIVSALGLDVSLQAGGGAALGTTDDENKSGKLRWSIDAGFAVDVYAIDLGALSLGLSTGVDYAMLNYYGETDISGGPIPFADNRISEPRYNYLFIPVALVGNIGLRGDKSLTVRLGGFAAYFLGGKTDLTYEPEVPGFLENGEADLDDTNTEQWMYGLRAYVGATVFQKDNLSIVPGIQFDLGLTDTSLSVLPFDTSKDTFWALIAIVALKYSFF